MRSSFASCFTSPGGTIRGTAATADAGGKRRRLTATRATREEVLAGLNAQAAALAFTGPTWTPQTTLGEAVERWIAALESEPEDEVGQKAEPIETSARTLRGVVSEGMEVVLFDQTDPELARHGRRVVKAIVVGSPSVTFGQQHRRTLGMKPLERALRARGADDSHDFPHPFP